MAGEVPEMMNFQTKIQPPAGIFAQGETRFVWHPQARLFGPDGAEHASAGLALAVIPAQPAASAVQAAFAAAAAGVAFRIGGPAEPPLSGPVPMFETLTGGSTGTPRRIRRTQASWIASFRINAEMFAISPGTAVAVLGALSHSLALYAAIEALHLGADLHLLGGLRPDRQMQALAARRVTVVYATPAQLSLLAEAGGVACVRQIVVGGGALAAGLRARLAEAVPAARIATFYGAAETSFVAMSHTDQDAAGLPYPGVAIDLRTIGPDGSGEVWVQSPYVAAGYGGPPGAARWADGWVTAGEWGRWCHGALLLVGREDRRVRIADQSVFPEEIEAFLGTLAGVVDVAVIARADLRRGQVLEAVLRGDPAKAAAILRAARTRFGPLAAPRALHWRQDWPLLPSGKPDLARLCAEAS